MRNALIILLAGVAGGIFPPVAALCSEPSSGVTERIEKESDGMIVIDIPPTILDLLVKEDERRPSSGQPALRPGVNKLAGYRIQVFSDGRNQGSLEARARARANAVVARFPKYRGQVYTFSSAPNWYARIGNFRTSSEAEAALLEIKRAFPQFASEMRVVKSSIVIIK